MYGAIKVCKFSGVILHLDSVRGSGAGHGNGPAIVRSINSKLSWGYYEATYKDYVGQDARRTASSLKTFEVCIQNQLTIEWHAV